MVRKWNEWKSCLKSHLWWSRIHAHSLTNHVHKQYFLFYILRRIRKHHEDNFHFTNSHSRSIARIVCKYCAHCQHYVWSKNNELTNLNGNQKKPFIVITFEKKVHVRRILIFKWDSIHLIIYLSFFSSIFRFHICYFAFSKNVNGVQALFINASMLTTSQISIAFVDLLLLL